MTEKAPTEDQIIRNLITEDSRQKRFLMDDLHGNLHPNDELKYTQARQNFQSNADIALSMIFDGTAAKLEFIEEGDQAWLAFPHPREGFRYRVSLPRIGPPKPTEL